MFPFDEKPISKIRTSLDIERYGKQSLLRALNIGRVVAFVGSGASLYFGQPRWKEIKYRTAMLFFVLENCIYKSVLWENDIEFEREYKHSILPVALEINEVWDQDSFDTMHFVKLCEGYFEEVGALINKHGGLTEEDLTKLFILAYKNGKPVRSAKKPGNGRSEYGPSISNADGISKPIVSRNEFRLTFAERFKSIVPVVKNESDGSQASDDTLRQATSIIDLLKAKEFNNDELMEDLINDAILFGNKAATDLEIFDGLRALRTELGIGRYLTLNYDLELERMLLEEVRSAPVSSDDFFRSFLNNLEHKDNELIQEYDRGPGRAVYLKSASGRVLRSTSSRKETLADLFAFGAFPTNYETSVHHLHGRVDDATNMIVTSHDYQTIYYGQNEQKKSFDEARHAVFTGSDVLVLGMGHSETDVLKPLRDFLELESNRREAHGMVYYLTSSKLDGLHANPEMAFTAAKLENMALAQKLHQTYGMYTLFIDHCFAERLGVSRKTKNQWQKGTARLFAARVELAYYRNLCDGKKSLTSKDNRFADGDSSKIWRKVFGDLLSSDDDELPEVMLARKFMAMLLSNHCNARNKLENIDLKISAKCVIMALDQRLLNRGVVATIKKISRERNDWWMKWSSTPGLRWAVYGPHLYTRNQDDSSKFQIDDSTNALNGKPLVWRQMNLVCDFGDAPTELGKAERTTQFTSLINETSAARQDAIALAEDKNIKYPEKTTLPEKYPAAIARLSIAPGGGKARIISFFTNEQNICGTETTRDFPFQYLFNTENSASATSLYRKTKSAGCFSAHLTFTLEFSSIIVGIVRFLQLRMMEFKSEVESVKPGDESQQEDGRWEKLVGEQLQKPQGRRPGLAILKDIYELLMDVCPDDGWSTRVVIILSYVDHLVDKNGDAYSPIHREFFRLISGWNNHAKHTRLPIDLILVNCHADKPIRYLSIEKSIKKNMERRSKEWVKNKWKFRHVRGCALQYWTPLERVNEENLIEEALLFSAKNLQKPIEKMEPDIIRDNILKILKKNGVIELPAGLRTFAQRRVVYAYLMAGLAVDLYAFAAKPYAEKGKSLESKFHIDFANLWDKHTQFLEAAYTRERTQGLFDALLTTYRRLDRDTGTADFVTHSRNQEKIESQKLERLSALVVDHLALFSHPVSPKTLSQCPEIFELLPKRVDGPCSVKTILEKLVQRGFACRYKKYSTVCLSVIDLPPDSSDSENSSGSEINRFVYSLDTKLTSALRAKANFSVYGHYSGVPFQPSLFSEQTENSIKPEYSHFMRVSAVVRALVKDTHTEIVELCETDYWASSENVPNQKVELIEFSDSLRAAYALIRGTFSLSVVSRLGDEMGTSYDRWPYDEYRTWVRKLLNTATLLTRVINEFREVNAKEDILAINEPFFRDEVAWLYNERALISFVQGRLFDALPLFGQALTVLGTTSQQNDPQSYKSTRRRVMVNLALAQLERGHIKRAHDAFSNIIEETSRRWKGDTPSTVNVYASGYLALCQHLSDDFANACEGYKNVIKQMEKFGFTRGQCIFRRHYGDLLRAMSKSRSDDEYLEAINQLKSAEELAMGIRATELQNYTLIAQARLHRDMQRRPEALENLRRVEEFSRKMGIQKMLTEVLKVRGEVLLAEGEATQAGFVTSQSIAMAKRNGMRLRKISAALIQAEILSTRNQKKDAARLLREILVESQSLGYATKTSAATKLLSTLS